MKTLEQLGISPAPWKVGDAIHTAKSMLSTRETTATMTVQGTTKLLLHATNTLRSVLLTLDS